MHSSSRSRILSKFLLVFITAFLLPSTFGFWQLFHYDLKDEVGRLTARIGNQAARATLALERHDAINKPALVRDLLAPLTADRSVECVELERADPLGASVPVPAATSLECSDTVQLEHELVLPIGDGQTSLVVKFTDAHLEREAQLRRNIMLGGLLLAAVVSVLAASIGFRTVVGRRMGNLNAALKQIAEGGERQRLMPGRNDELGEIIGAFNQMIASEVRREEELQNTEAALRRANDRLASLTRESEQRFRDFVASASDWYWEMDDQLRFSYFSDRFTETTGVPKEALLGKTRRETGIPMVNEEAWEEHLRALDEHRAFRNFEHPRIKSPGKTVWLSISGTPAFDDDGTFTGYRGTGRDVTERERAKELAREKDISEQIARTKSEFLANMSHEIRTPINGVLGMTEILLKSELDSTQHRFATTIRRSGEALLRVINDILDFSKIEAGKMTLQSAPFHLRELMEDVGELFAESAHGKGLELLSHTPTDLPGMYRGDAGRLRQILTNLVGNAIKFTETGEVVLRVALQEDEGEHCILRFEVTDSGIGIEPDAQARVFDSFAQVDGSTQRRYGGTGLGLSISAQLARLMGGDIGLQSTPGEGSTFWFTLRLANLEGAREPEPHALREVRVLVVDDNATNREILEHQLSAWEMHCECAQDGHSALAALVAAVESGAPHQVVILDMHMPGMDGLTLSRRIDEDPRIAGVPQIMLSSVCDDLDARKELLKGIQAYLLKPVRQSELHRCLDSVVNCKGGDATIDPQQDRNVTTLKVDARILLVEDNLVNQEVALAFLEPLGATVVVAQDGHAAVDAWSGDDFDLIFMDCQMPGMNGFEATGVIRNRESGEARGRVPIVAMTANALQGDRERCLDAGMDDYLSKPFNEQQLCDVLQRWLPQASVLEPDQAPPQSQPDPDVAVLDASVLEGFRERERRGRKNVLGRIVAAFIEQSAGQVEQLHNAAQAQDTRGIREIAHSLKSSSAQVGATGLSQLCREMEERAIEGSMHGMSESMAALDCVYPRVCAALTRETDRAAA